MDEEDIFTQDFDWKPCHRHRKEDQDVNWIQGSVEMHSGGTGSGNADKQAY
jgi:hypothetical protein